MDTSNGEDQRSQMRWCRQTLFAFKKRCHQNLVFSKLPFLWIKSVWSINHLYHLYHVAERIDGCCGIAAFCCEHSCESLNLYDSQFIHKFVLVNYTLVVIFVVLTTPTNTIGSVEGKLDMITNTVYRSPQSS